LPLGPTELDRAVRLKAFEFLRASIDARGDEILPWGLLLRGFEFDGVRVPLLSQQGIFKPAILPDIPLSIRTTPEQPGRERPYDDGAIDEGVFTYKYRGQDPMLGDNVGLRRAMQSGVPLVYFYGIEKGLYQPVWPVFVVGDNPRALEFTIEADDSYTALHSSEWDNGPESEPRRRYVTTSAQRRLHQSAFRVHVLRAYQESCAICRLKHPELLEASHIIEDKDPRGIPAVSNGLSLCAIHHKAFDQNILGIRPDYRVELNAAVLRERDGPMLRYGLQEFHEKAILVPKRKTEQPDREKLEERFERFRKAV
jgi:putative restriction endonuclease